MTVSLITALQPPPGNLALNAVAFSPDGKYLASGGWGAGFSNGTTDLWNIATRTPSAPLTNPGGSSGGVYSVAYSPDGQTLAVGDQSGTVYLWNTTTDKPIDTLSDPGGGQVNSLAWAPAGNILATDGGSYIYLWSLTTK
jgi:WD40 repeat protein